MASSTTAFDLVAMAQRLDAVINSARDGIIIADAELRILLLNPAAEGMFGYAVADAAGESAERLLPGLRDGSQPPAASLGVIALAGTRADGSQFPLEASVAESAAGDERLFTIIARDVTERARAQASLEASERALAASRSELQRLAARLLTASEDERRRISHELHDDVNQRLAVVTVELESLQRSGVRSARALAGAIEKVKGLLTELSEDVQRMAYDLHPRVIDDLGFGVALKAHVLDIGRRYGVGAEMRERGRGLPLPPPHSLCLYRVAQEALRNVVRHSQARRLVVTLARNGESVGLCVRDFGVGFDPDVSRSGQRGLGLVSMEERARLLGGRLVVRSRRGRGTHVHAWLPVPESAAADAAP
jgi:PAS domain S-box-containing protein